MNCNTYSDYSSVYSDDFSVYTLIGIDTMLVDGCFT